MFRLFLFAFGGQNAQQTTWIFMLCLTLAEGGWNTVSQAA